MIDHNVIIAAAAFGGGFLVRHLANRSKRAERVDPLLAATAAIAHQTAVTGQEAWVVIRNGCAFEYCLHSPPLPLATIDASRANALSDTLQLMVHREEILLQLIDAGNEKQSAGVAAGSNALEK